jgi:rRNA maturation RNase YbeY
MSSTSIAPTNLRNLEFHTEDIDFTLPQKSKVREWLVQVAGQYGLGIRSLVYIFCSDEYLHKLNVEYLDHDTLTDIITFDYNEDAGPGRVAGELYISLDRIKDNAQDLNEPWERELARVMAHGLLHLCGLKDKTDAEAQKMRAAEQTALTLWETKVKMQD